MQLPITGPRTIRPAPVAWVTAMALLAVVLAGCGATPSSSAADEATPDPSVAQSTVASPTPEATASAAPEVCLPEDIITAIGEISRANFEPATPLNEVANALEALEFREGELFAEVRDELVNQLRDPDPDQTRQELVHVANVFLSDGGAPQC